ncbi:MAG TPA: MFS transporter [Clostridiales bacterium]|nr:MFS transporter [Clostridiales bacterium]
MAKEQTLRQKATSSFRYAVGMFGTSIPINMFKTYALAFYVDMLGLAAKKYSKVIFIYTFVDALDNPVYGFLSDRTRTPWGRRRPWLVIGTPLLILFFVLFYSVPASVSGPAALGNDTPLFVYMLLTYILTGTLDSLINANYGALFPELFPVDIVRAKTNAMRQAFQLVAMVISIGLTPLITKQIGYRNTAFIYGALALTVILYCTFGCHENLALVHSEKPQFVASIKALFTNPKFWIFGLANAFYSAAGSIIMQVFPLFVKYALRLDSGKTTILMGCVFGSTILSIAGWSALAKKRKMTSLWKTAMAMFGFSFIPMYFVGGLGGAVAVSALLGICYGGVLATNDVIAAKIMDEDTAKYGLRREGIYSSAMGFMNRLNGLFVSLAVYSASHFFGYISGNEPGPNPAGASRFLMVICSIIALAVGSAFAMFVRFREHQQAGEEKVQAL